MNTKNKMLFGSSFEKATKGWGFNQKWNRLDNQFLKNETRHYKCILNDPSHVRAEFSLDLLRHFGDCISYYLL